jgi:large conductance mechanosensitive channel
MLCSAKQHAA